MSVVHVRRTVELAVLLGFAAWIALLAVEPAGSAPIVRTWTGNGANNNWTTAANWDAGPPIEGDILVFPAVANRKANTNDFPNFTEFEEIRLQGAGYTLSGNRAVVLEYFTHNPGAGVNTVSFIIDGEANLLQQSGRLELTAANSHGGNTIVSDGELYVANPLALGEFSSTLDIYGGVATIAAEGTYFQALDIGGADAGLAVTANAEWFGPVQLFGATEFNVQQNMTFEIVSDITGGGAVAKAGGGTLFFSGDNTFAGVLDIQQGAVRVSRDTGLGSDLDGTVVADGAVLELDGPVFIEDEFIQLDGILNSAAQVNHLGRVLIGEDATIHVGQDILRLTNGLDEAAADLLVEKTGGGQLEFEGAGDFAGDIELTAGSISVRGALLASVLINGGRLTGDGSVGAVSGARGELVPGVASNGTLTVNGPLSLSPDMDVDFVIESAAEYTALRVNGPVTLDDPVLFVGGAGVIPPGGQATLIENESATPINGEFLLRPEGGNLGVDGNFFILTYAGGAEPANDFVLSRPAADLDVRVTMAGNPTSAPNVAYTYSISTQNLGQTDVGATLLRVVIPQGASYMSAQGAVCSHIMDDAQGATYHCALPSIPSAPEARTVTITAAITVGAGLDVIFRASIEPRPGEPAANNAAELKVIVAAGGLGFRIGLPAVASDGSW